MSLRIPNGSSVWHVVEHHAVLARRSMRSLILSGFLGPIITTFALGWGIGSQISDASALGTEDYLHFVGPGVLVATAMLQGGFSSLWEAKAALEWQGMYKNVVRSPATYTDALTGRLVWMGIRTALASVAFLFVLLVAIGWKGTAVLLVPLIAGLTAMAAAAPILAYVSRQPNDRTFAVIGRLVLTPLFVFSGTFASVETLPVLAEWSIKLFPTHHGVQIARDLVNQRAGLVPSLGHLVVIVLWIATGWVLSIGGFRKALSS